MEIHEMGMDRSYFKYPFDKYIKIWSIIPTNKIASNTSCFQKYRNTR